MTLPALHKSQTAHIHEMMKRLGIEPGVGVLPRWSLSYATAQRQCRNCLAKGACDQWLDHAADHVAFAPRFCPNADIFFELQSEQPAMRYVQPDCGVGDPPLDDTQLPDDSDLKYLQSEIEEALLRCPEGDHMLEELKRRQEHLKKELERLSHISAEHARLH